MRNETTGSIMITSPVVSVDWLAAHLGHPKLVVLDASLQPVGGVASSQDTVDIFQIPQAQVFDIDKKVCDVTSSLPHTMPSPERFEQEVQTLGVSQDSVIVVYDRMGIYSSPRAFWMFQAMGHDQVAVLDGGFPAWLEAGKPYERRDRASAPVPGNFVARPRSQFFCDADQVMAALLDEHSLVLDARSAGRYAGSELEPRPGLRGGHMPGASNLPFSTVLQKGRICSVAELEKIFASKVGTREKLIFTCGSGVTSCVLALAARMAGYQDLAVYDGSWSEWGLPSSRPVVLGP